MITAKHRTVFLNSLKIKSEFETKKSDLDLQMSRDGINLLRSVKTSETKHISEDQFIKYILSNLKIATESVNAESNLYFEDVQSGYVFKHSEKYYLEPNVVIRHRQPHSIEKVTELFNDKLSGR